MMTMSTAEPLRELKLGEARQMAPGKSTTARSTPRRGAGKSGSTASGAIDPMSPASLSITMPWLMTA
jgi:hypothetical protein